MHRFSALAVAAGLLASPAAQAAAPRPAAPVVVTLRAADGVVIQADLYRAPRPRALILLFHQAGSSAAEYATIAPRLVGAGYSALAIDQRSGGSLFGKNRTVATLGRPADYLEARRDLEAALAWGERQKLPIILWGSSYSAALVFLVASDHPDAIKAVLAFSPGEYLGQKDMVRRAAMRVRAPVFVTSASDAGEMKAAKAILDASPSRLKEQFVPHVGIHGSSTLIAARNPRGEAENWRAVLAFLRRAAG